MSRIDRKYLVGLLLVWSFGSSAQADLVAPQMANEASAPRISNSVGKPVEGWAIVRYSVGADGSPDNIRVVDSVPEGADRDAITASVEQWRFAPATRDGQAIDWYNNESVVLFAEASRADEPPADFVDAYTALADEIGDVDYLRESGSDTEELKRQIFLHADAAAAESARLLNEIAVRREDIGLALVQAAIIEVGRAEYSAALDPLQLATHPGVGALNPSDLFVALQYQFQVETQLGRTLEALATHARIAAGYGPEDFDPYKFRADELAAAMEDEEYLPVYGSIEQRPWHIDLARRYFYVDDIVGSIDTLTAECDTRRQVLDFEPQSDYSIPQAFGACTVFVSGDPGTTFTFVEVRVDEN